MFKNYAASSGELTPERLDSTVAETTELIGIPLQSVTVILDKNVGYDKHSPVQHGKNKFVKSIIHINGIESFWNYDNRRLA